MTVAVIFVSRRADGHEIEYAATADRMDELARVQPGFVEMVSVRDPETRMGITVSYFIDEDSARAWKEHPEHLVAQRRGVTEFYEEYRVTVAEVTRRYGFP